jgi:hypothetical protein
VVPSSKNSNIARWRAILVIVLVLAFWAVPVPELIEHPTVGHGIIEAVSVFVGVLLGSLFRVITRDH